MRTLLIGIFLVIFFFKKCENKEIYFPESHFNYTKKRFFHKN